MTINSLLKSCDPVIRDYIREMKSENSRLQKQIIKLEIENVSNNNRIDALTKELKKIKVVSLESLVAGD